LNVEQLDFLKSNKFALVGFYQFNFAPGTAGNYETEEPAFPCSYYDTLKDIDRDLAVYLCIVEFINQGKKEANPELYRKIHKRYSGGKGSRGYSVSATIDYETSTSGYFPTGKKVNQMKDSGSNASIPEENLRNFLLNFLSSVRHAGLKEAESVVNLEYSKSEENSDFGQTEKNTEKITGIKLKNLDVDYWIIAHHSRLYNAYTDWFKRNPSYKGKPSLKTLTLLPAIFSLFTFPYWDKSGFESKFYIYDNKLNLIKTFEYQNEYDHISAWWVFWKNKDAKTIGIGGAGIPPISIYEPDVKDFTKEMYNTLKNESP
jgi:hypothetical protein